MFELSLVICYSTSHDQRHFPLARCFSDVWDNVFGSI